MKKLTLCAFALIFFALAACAGRVTPPPYTPEYPAADLPTTMAAPPAGYTPAPTDIPSTALDMPTPGSPLPYEYYPQPATFVDYWLNNLTLEEKIGQLIMPRLPWRTTSAKHMEIQDWLDAIPFGGFILFSDNVESIPQVQALTRDLRYSRVSHRSDRYRLPNFISTDEEGGRVSRVGSLFGGATPAAFTIGEAGDLQLTYDTAAVNAQRLVQLGINMNFAPVADVWSNPANAVIGTRAFGHTAEVAAPNVAATVQGLQDSGIFATLKHFPGHGDTYEDSHYQLAFHNHGIDRFWEVEALPFAAGIEAGAAAVMTGHISTPQVTGHTALLPWMEPWIESGNLPATFSDFWLQTVLRGQLGFEGLIITDGLEMRALTDHF
ncbi:MAG: hypothetical protein FWG38_10575, partial [Defluviitaleaceae bacterium]|nr:hypothetical protein [Defluviitaleaceae bacterium]